MKKYKAASDQAQSITFSNFKQRMKHKKITQKEMCKILGCVESTLVRYFKKETPMPLDVYFQICGILELRPYLVPLEMDANEMNRIDSN